MDWYPLFNSLRIAALSSIIVFFTGIAAAYYAVRLPRLAKGVLDVVLTLPLVLRPRSWAIFCCCCSVPAVHSASRSSKSAFNSS